MTPLLWSDSIVHDGQEFSAEVRQDWMMGHGPIEGRYRWTVFIENKYRPRYRYGWTHNAKSSIEYSKSVLNTVMES